MTREDDFVTVLAADGTLTAILTGGIYARGALARNGLTRETVPAAFDGTTGYLLPCAVVAQRGLVPDGAIRDGMEKVTSISQVIEIYCYADDTGETLDPALDRIYRLLEGHIFDNAFPCEFVNLIRNQRDRGALDGAALSRIDFAVAGIMVG